MTVKELMEALCNLEDDAVVLLEGLSRDGNDELVTEIIGTADCVTHNGTQTKVFISTWKQPA